MTKFKTSIVHDWLSGLVTAIGPSPWLQLRTGPEEASVTAPATGVLTYEMPLPTAPFTTPFAGEIGKAGTWTSNALAVGVVGHFRVLNNAKTECLWLGSVTQAVGYELTADAGGGTSTLSVASTAAITLGEGVSGVGVEDGTLVASKTSTTIVLNKPLQSGMFTGESIVVGDVTGDLVISGAYINSIGDPATVVSLGTGWPQYI
jgi:hypothetical protein